MIRPPHTEGASRHGRPFVAREFRSPCPVRAQTLEYTPRRGELSRPWRFR